MSKRTFALACAALGLLAAAPAQAAEEVQVYGIANFGGTGQCGNSDMTHSVHTATAAAFRGTFDFYKSVALWDEVASLNNTSAKGSLFQDSTKQATGVDSTANTGIDDADVMYVHTHGSHTVKSDGTAYTTLSMGNSANVCKLRTDADVLMGNTGGDLDIAVVKACQSGDYDVWKAGGYSKMRTGTGSFTMWNAFHGDSSCGGHVTDYVGDYSALSMNEGVGENWLDEAYDGAFWPWEDDDCPISLVYGSSKTVRKTMYEHGGWRDRKDTGQKSGSSYYYIAGCDPDHGAKLPE